MSSINERLAILSDCINYRNLTSASKHVGLSQPQLSRIIKQIEEDLSVILLDRTSPRHSSWTPEARGVSEIYLKSAKYLNLELDSYLEGMVQRNIKIGCLEGLVNLGVDAAAKLLNETHIENVTVNLYDLNQLEAKFLSLDLDLAFTSRAPGSRKLSFEKECGFQLLQKLRDKEGNFQILSSFEDLALKASKKKKGKKRIVSNSLAVRKAFQKKYGGDVLLPSDVMKASGSNKNAVPVLLIGQDHLSNLVWRVLT